MPLALARAVFEAKREKRRSVFFTYASVAQLDRVLLSEGKGCGFKSRRVHQKIKL